MPTALLSNHNGRSSVAGIPIDAQQINGMVDALNSNGELKHVDAVLSGYLTALTGPTVLRTVEKCREHHPDAMWVCDPVMGDMVGDQVRTYVPDDTVAFMKEAVQSADVLVPNVAELGILTDTMPLTIDEIVDAARGLDGPKFVVVTSVPHQDENGDGLAMVAVAGERLQASSMRSSSAPGTIPVTNWTGRPRTPRLSRGRRRSWLPVPRVGWVGPRNRG